MKDLWLYLRARRWHIVLWAINWALFALMARLGGMGAENVAYTALLSAVCALAVGAADCRQFLKKHRLLQDICRQTRLAAGSLPECGANALEQDYQALVRALESDMAAAVSRTDRKMADLAAYYTLWAHQIKTPIAAMHLLVDEDGEAARELFKIEQYVDMLLSYIRLESDVNDLVLRPCDLDAILRAAARKYARFFIHQGLRLEIQPTGRQVLTDEKWFGFCVEQLLSNAVKYTKAGSVTVAVDAEKQLLTISDTGIGIAPEDLPRVFEQGYTGENGREQQRATGLGLYLCREALTRLGHSIQLESTPGQGTTAFVGLERDEREYE